MPSPSTPPPPPYSERDKQMEHWNWNVVTCRLTEEVITPKIYTALGILVRGYILQARTFNPGNPFSPPLFWAQTFWVDKHTFCSSTAFTAFQRDVNDRNYST